MNDSMVNSLFFLKPKYLGVTLDRTHMHCWHLASLCEKLTSRIALLTQLAGLGWDARATTFQTATLALVQSTAEYCAPVWCYSAHTRLIDPAINNALQIVTGSMHPTPVDKHPRRHPICWASSQRGHTARYAMKPGHLLHPVLTMHWVGRHSIWNQVTHLHSSHNNSSAHLVTTYVRHTDHQWNAEWLDNTTRLCTFIPDTGTHLEWSFRKPPGFSLTAFAPMLYVSTPGYTNGYGSPCSLWVLWRRTNHQPCCPPTSNSSTYPWTAWPDRSGRRDKWMGLLNTCPEI